MSDGFIGVERTEGVLTLRIQRPQKKNALTTAMYLTLREAVLEADADPATGALLLTGCGDYFSAGNDLHDFRTRALAENPSPSAGLALVEALASCETPVVAAVNGPAIGIGTTMLLHCDFVYAGPAARFRTPFIDLGLCPEAASSLLLPMLIGPRRANEMLLAGEALDAEQALAYGLINGVCDDCEARALEQARRLARKPRESVRLTKRLLRRFWHRAIAETLEHEGEQFAARLKSAETQAALDGFFARPKD
jgi:enoyl-CoA hydratase/carnithine racemase